MEEEVMIREYSTNDLEPVVTMLKAMYKEVFPLAVDDTSIYRHELLKCVTDPKIVTLVDSEYKGFAMVRDDTEAMVPDMKRYNITRAYIKPEYRGSRTYLNFMNHIVDRFNHGDIMGMTDAKSNHIPILQKRQELVAMVFKYKKGE